MLFVNLLSFVIVRGPENVSRYSNYISRLKSSKSCSYFFSCSMNHLFFCLRIALKSFNFFSNSSISNFLFNTTNTELHSPCVMITVVHSLIRGIQEALGACAYCRKQCFRFAQLWTASPCSDFNPVIPHSFPTNLLLFFLRFSWHAPVSSREHDVSGYLYVRFPLPADPTGDFLTQKTIKDPIDQSFCAHTCHVIIETNLPIPN